MTQLLIQGGTVIDPSQSLNGVRDVLIEDGLIQEVSVDIPVGSATVYDASEKIVTPGLVDILAHPWPQGNPALGVDPDSRLSEGVTTVVSPGDPGAWMVRAFRKDTQTKTARVYGYVMISDDGYKAWPVTVARSNIHAADVAAALVANSDIMIGVKVLFSEGIIGSLDLLPIEYALLAAECAQAQTGKFFPVVVHTGGLRTQSLLSQAVDILRPGDVITHCFAGSANSQGQPTGFAQNWACIEAAYTAKTKGVLLDVGWSGSMDFLTTAICMEPLGHAAPGIRPDTLSSDDHASGRMKLVDVGGAVLALNVPSNIAGGYFTGHPNLSPAITLDDVVRMMTVTPAQVIGDRVPKLGTLQVGAPADVAVMNLVVGATTFTDSPGRTLAGTQRLVNVKTVKGGVLI